MSLNCYRGQFEEIGPSYQNVTINYSAEQSENENKEVRHVMFQNSTNPAALTH